MNYYGIILDKSLSEEAMDSALRPALMQVGSDSTIPVRGPKEYVNGELDYEDYEIETDWGYYFDGSGALYEFDFDYEHGSVIGDYEFRGRYNYQNGELEITAKVDDDGKYELISLTPSKMVLSLIWDYFEDGVQYKDVEKYTLQKFVIDK